MADLANLRGRDTAQRRITNNRDGVLPQRRNTDLDAVQVRADMRTASRGDGGADELRRVLGEFQRGVQSADAAGVQNSMDRRRDEAADGMADAIAGGEADPERQRQMAYQEAFYRVRAESRANAFSSTVSQEVEQAINGGADPAEIQALMVERVTSFRQDEIDALPTASARRTAALKVAELARTLETTVSQRIMERTREELTATLDGNIGTFLANYDASPQATTGATEGDPTDPEGLGEVVVTAARPAPIPVEDWIATYRDAGYTPAEAKTRTVAALAAVALDRNNPRPELLEQLLDSTQADGRTPSLNAAEQIQVQNTLSQARQLRDSVEREAKEEAREDMTLDLFTRALNGEVVDTTIQERVVDGTLTVQEASAMLGLVSGFVGQIGDGIANEDFVLDVTRRSIQGNPPSTAEILQWERDGRFGTGRAGKRAAMQFIADNVQASQARRGGGGGGSGGGGAGGSYLSASEAGNRNISTARSYLGDVLDPGDEGSDYQRQMFIYADRWFNQQVRAGMDPLQAATQAQQRFAPYIEGRKGATAPGGRLHTPTIPPPDNTVRYDSQGNRIN